MRLKKIRGQSPFSLREKRTVPIFLLFFLLLVAPAFAGDEAFVTSSNWGGTGLMETPTARVMKEGQFRVGVGVIEPYRNYYGALSPFKGVEIDFRFTEIADVYATGLPASYGAYKDKVADIKYQFIPEMKWFPALALGLNDPLGTRRYGSQYIVANKQIYPFDFSVGFGNGRYGRKPLSASGDNNFTAEIFQDPRGWLSDGLFFGGVQFAPTKWLTLMAEYNSIRYDQQNDPAQPVYFTSPVPSKFNFGLRWKPYEWIEADLSYQRGNQVGVNVAMNFELGQPMLPIFDLPYKEKAELRLNPLAERLDKALKESGFTDIGIKTVGNDIWIETMNDKYYYSPKAVGVVMRILKETLPLYIEKVHLTFTDKGIPVLSFVTTREDIVALYEEKLTLKEFLFVSQFRTDVYQNLDVEKKDKKYYHWGIYPAFRMFVNDPSGFFKYRLGVNEWIKYNPWKGSMLMVNLEQYPINNVSTTNTPSAQPVRTDFVYYTYEKTLMDKLLMDQMVKLPNEIYARAAFGYLETEYAGLDWEVAKPLWGGRVMVGLSGSVVKKREVGNAFAMMQNDWKNYYTTAFLNTALNIPEAEVSLDLRTGQFLAGDRGTRITLSKFFNGVILFGWYSMTNSNEVFTDSYNRGYSDKGIGVVWPLRLFIGKDSRNVYSFAVSPWTRDVAQDIEHVYGLFDFMGRNQEVYWKKDRGMMN